MTFDSSYTSHIFSMPFVGILLSISLGPVLFSHFWHKNYFKIAIAWSVLSITFLVYRFGFAVTYHEWLHMLFKEYIPFILMITSLYIITGGIHIVIKTRAKARTNLLLLLFGSFIASFIGTTGAAMLMIRPFIEMNRHRRYKIHLVIFFIFTVANIGGSLTPLGDPPLFLGYLQGVPFWWPMQHLGLPMLKLMALLLTIFFFMDHYLLKKEEPQPKARAIGEKRLNITGLRNIPILLSLVLGVWLLGSWSNSPEIGFMDLNMAEVVRDLMFIGLAAASWKLTSGTIRHYNHYSWEPLKEVAQLFIGIFTTIIPVIKMLNQGVEGPFAFLINIANPGGQPNEKLYFWLTGWLSAFLDNAPTYLVFFHMAGGNVDQLTTTMAPTLMAISAGAVFMGAMTYVGNAPNFMVKAIAEKNHIKMPSFFGYMVWSCTILLPLLAIFCWFFLTV